MEIRSNENVCVIAPLSLKLDKFDKILDKIEDEKRYVALDLSFVQDCTIEFIEMLRSLKTKKIGIFNIPSDIFVLFNIMNVDKFVELFVSENDFEEKRRRLINRNFKLI